MTETITINGKDYKPEPVLMTSDDCIKLDGQLYALKPIDKTRELISSEEQS